MIMMKIEIMTNIFIHQIKKMKIVLMMVQKIKDLVIQVYIVKKIVNILITNSLEKAQHPAKELF